jgi:hypothetical protein
MPEGASDISGEVPHLVEPDAAEIVFTNERIKISARHFNKKESRNRNRRSRKQHYSKERSTVSTFAR